MISRRGLLRGLLALPVVGVAAKFAGKAAKKVWHRFTIRGTTRVTIPEDQMTDKDRADIEKLKTQGPQVWTWTNPETGRESTVEINLG